MGWFFLSRICRFDPVNRVASFVRKGLVAAGLALLLVTASTFGQPALARWIDTKTLEPVSTWPITPAGRAIQPSIGNPNYAFDPETGRNLVRDECGDWIDTKTLKPVSAWPITPEGRVIQPMTCH